MRHKYRLTVVHHTIHLKGNPVASSTDVRPKITLACEVCKHRNYITKKNRRNDPDRLEIKTVSYTHLTLPTIYSV